MLVQTFGRLRQEAQDRRGVRFERVYDYRPEELWAAITEPEQIRGWFGETSLDLERGEGSVRFEDGQIVTLRVRRLEPGKLVEYDWGIPGEPPSVLRLELEPQERGTLLVLDHRRLTTGEAVGYGAGWHAHLDGLERFLVGESVDWDERFGELRPAYGELAEALPGNPELGELAGAGDRRDLHHRRVIAAPVAAVWAALTEPEQWRIWMGADEASVDARRGGAVALRWPDGDRMSGEITEWDPPRALEYTWQERVERGRVRFELEETRDGTLVTFEHSDIPVSALVGMSAGWHAHFDWLRAQLKGEDFEFRSRYRELGPVYEDIVADMPIAR
jgi:uncharacterized protein YndB with AHSA1/START domain